MKALIIKLSCMMPALDRRWNGLDLTLALGVDSTPMYGKALASRY